MALQVPIGDCPVNDQTPWISAEPGKPTLNGVNWGGLKTLYIKEVKRFFKVQMQTVWAPAITTLLYLVIFTVALGRSGRTVLGVPFADFIAPGLIMMAMLQNAFANASFSLLVGKMQGTIVDYLMPPLSTGELIAVPIPLDREEVVLGRALEADVRVNDTQVSRRHAMISARSSTEGTFEYLLTDLRRFAGVGPRSCTAAEPRRHQQRGQLHHCRRRRDHPRL